MSDQSPDQDPIEETEIVCVLAPSMPRRSFSTGILYVLAALLGYLALTGSDISLAQRGFLLLVAAVLVYGGRRMWHATDRIIELTEQELRLSDGQIICKLDDVAKVDRSFFAFKPSNGFLITLKADYPRAWFPGLWWRIGKRIGIGGVTPAAQGKSMADTMSTIMAIRSGEIEL